MSSIHQLTLEGQLAQIKKEVDQMNVKFQMPTLAAKLVDTLKIVEKWYDDHPEILNEVQAQTYTESVSYLQKSGYNYHGIKAIMDKASINTLEINLDAKPMKKASGNRTAASKNDKSKQA